MNQQGSVAEAEGPQIFHGINSLTFGGNVSPNLIAGEIATYVNNNGGSPRAWYVGIASDPRTRLFNDHNLQEHSDFYICRDCGTHQIARDIEQHFLNQGCDGGPGGGDTTTRFVYAYKKNGHTRQ